MGSLDEENNLSYVTADYQLIWMGLRQDDEGGYYWTDGTPLDYTHYKTDQPDDYNGVDNCIINDWYYSYSNGWESHNCESEMPFFCEVVAGMVAPTTAAPPTVPPALPCDEGQAHHMFSRFLNQRTFFTNFSLFCFPTRQKFSIELKNADITEREDLQPSKN